MGEIVIHAQSFRDGFVFGEFLAIVGGDGVQHPFERKKHLDGLVADDAAVVTFVSSFPIVPSLSSEMFVPVAADPLLRQPCGAEKLH